MTDTQKPTRRRRLWACGCGAGAVALLGAAIPAMAAAGTTTVTYYACVTNKTGALKIVSKSTVCARGTHKISWNNTGPHGPKGATGSQGATGRQGPGGPPGVVSGYASANTNEVTVSDSALSPTSVGTLSLPAGNFLVMAKTTVLAAYALATNDDVVCSLVDGGGNDLDFSASQLEPANGSSFDYQTIPLEGSTSVGGTINVYCYDDLSDAAASYTSIIAEPVASLSASPSHLPHFRDGKWPLRLTR
jgi:hypothetical protein